MAARTEDGGFPPASGVPAAGQPRCMPAAAAPPVSVVIPARNAEKTVGEAIDSVLAQRYPGPLEVVVADGSDTPSTADLLRRRYPEVRVVANPNRTASAGLQAGIRVASGDIVARLDAHAAFPSGYLCRAVETLRRTGAANVGGRQSPAGRTAFERAVGLAMTTWIGAGGARYRLGGPAGPVDTVYLGVFRRAAIEAAGGFDPAMARNEDYELNWRLRQHGEIVWFDPRLAVAYRPRGGLGRLARQYFDYGRWKRAMLRRHPSSLRARQLAAPLLVASLAISPLLALADAAAAVALPAVWLLAVASVSVAVGLRRREPAAILLPATLATMHLSWGAGFLTAILRTPSGETRRLRGSNRPPASPRSRRYGNGRLLPYKAGRMAGR